MPTPTASRSSQTRCWQLLWAALRYDAMARKVLHTVAAQRGATQRRHMRCAAVHVMHRFNQHLTAMRLAAGNCYVERCGGIHRCRAQYGASAYAAVESTVLASNTPRPTAMHPIAVKCNKKKYDTPQYVALDRYSMPNYDLLRNESDALHRMYSTASKGSGARSDGSGSSGSAALTATPGSGGSTATAARTSSGGSAATAARHRS